MLDEMAISKHIEYINGRYHGHVDVGSGEFFLNCQDFWNRIKVRLYYNDSVYSIR